MGVINFGDRGVTNFSDSGVERQPLFCWRYFLNFTGLEKIAEGSMIVVLGIKALNERRAMIYHSILLYKLIRMVCKVKSCRRKR